MKKTRLAILLPAVALSGVLLLSLHQRSSAQSVPATNPAVNLNLAALNFTAAQANPDEAYQVIRAFVPTGSRSVKCLATLGETNIFPVPNAMFCGEREPAAFGGEPGMLISVFLPQPVSPDFVLSVTLYQQGAKRYGTPVLCKGSDGC